MTFVSSLAHSISRSCCLRRAYLIDTPSARTLRRVKSRKNRIQQHCDRISTYVMNKPQLLFCVLPCPLEFSDRPVAFRDVHRVPCPSKTARSSRSRLRLRRVPTRFGTRGRRPLATRGRFFTAFRVVVSKKNAFDPFPFDRRYLQARVGVPPVSLATRPTAPSVDPPRRC